jgi:hypothetical protein
MVISVALNAFCEVHQHCRNEMEYMHRSPLWDSYWQVADCSEQYGCFKMTISKYKHDLLQRKELVGAEFAINKQDINYTGGQAWASSFAHIKSHLKASAE